MEVKLIPSVTRDARKDVESRIPTQETVLVETPSGQVFIGHDSVAGMTLVTVRGEKGSITIKFNERAVA